MSERTKLAIIVAASISIWGLMIGVVLLVSFVARMLMVI